MQPYQYVRQLLYCCATLLFISSCQSKSNQSGNKENTAPKKLSKAEALIHETVSAVGGANALKELKDVEFQYTYTSFDGFADVSTERYLFDGEYSRGEYTTHKNAVMTTVDGVVTQGYDGNTSWVTVGNAFFEDETANKMSAFLRKTNLYWFCMNFKLLDPGVEHSYEGTRRANDIDYELVRISFEEGIGTSEDEFLLYLNPHTKLIDQFLFTVKALGIESPLMMRVKYEEVSGVKLTTYREYAPANWQGELTSDEGWTTQVSSNIQFNNGFTPDDFRSLK
ncbi:MAG: hypothetical protein HEP71_24105 [Roseivirga sp.]|nr:hypothetical protein [Roseivirga sp.]